MFAGCSPLNRFPRIYAGIMGRRDVCSLSALKQQSVRLSRPTCQAICSQSLRQSSARLSQENVPPLGKWQSHGTQAGVCACAPITDRRQEGWWRKSEDAPVRLHFTVTGKQSHGFPSVLLSFLPPSLPPFLPFCSLMN